MQLIKFTFLLFILLNLNKKSTEDEQMIEHIKTQIVRMSEHVRHYTKPNDNYVSTTFQAYLLAAQFHLTSHGFYKQYLEHEVLGFPEKLNSTKFYQSLNELMKRIQKTSEIQLSNTIFSDDKFMPAKSFLKDMKTYFNSEIINVDLTTNENLINQFIANKTENRITSLLTTSISKFTKVIVVDSLHFKALWDLKFNSSNTKEAFFYSPNESITVQMIEKTVDACYKETPFYRMAKIDISKSISLGILIPHYQGDDVSENVLNTTELDTIIKQPCSRVVLDIQLPCSTFNYYKADEASGFGTLFADAANLTNLKNDKDSQFSEFYDFSSYRLDENIIGTEKKILDLYLRCARSISRMEFVVNRPFYYWLIENGTGILLYLGKVNKPSLV